MNLKTTFLSIVFFAFSICTLHAPREAQAATIDLVSVGNSGNAGELSGSGAGGFGPDAIVGGVNYNYQIDKFEVTAGQYTEFLNAVADTDTYALYHISMAGIYGCGIQQSGSSGSYIYSVAADWAGRPVNYVSWGDAARFANWLSNNQQSGAQGAATTEDGSYLLNASTSQAALMAVTRKPNATWVIPTEDEWYKAAYHKNDGVTGNYWDYPTGTNVLPDNGNPAGDTGNTANFWDETDYTASLPYRTTPVGNFDSSDSTYGTFDQGGNLWEWNETVLDADALRGLRGGYWNSYYYYLLSSYRSYGIDPTYENYSLGFRVARVPEPGNIALLVYGAATALILWRRWR